jgi:hypothetical protein
MEDKYNHLSIAEYGTRLAKSLCDRYFAEQQTISGPQLISFTPIRQVNLFVIKELLVQWNREMAHLRSPYFDFENEEVKAALVQFMNVLSRKILIQRPHFEPLLSKAIHDTFRVVLDPVSILDEKFLNQMEDPTIGSLQENLKYLDLNKALFSDFLGSLSGSRLDRAYLLDKFREFLQQPGQEQADIEPLLNQFDRLMPIKRQDITGKSSSFFEEEFEPAPAPPPPRPNPSREQGGSQIRVERKQGEAPAPGPAKPVVPKPAVAVESNLNEKYKIERPSRADLYAKTTTTSLAENQINKSVQSLKDSISINQRYGFINELFNGENMEYHNTIKKLEGFEDADSAKNYLLKDVAPRYDWSKKEDLVSKLLKLIDRKYTHQ